MAQVIPPTKIKSFRSAAEFEKWLSKQHDRETELWLRFFKKDSGRPTVSYAEALDVVLCWGWIDGIRKAYDEISFLQRYSPRKSKSVWSHINRENIARLVAAGRMTEHGQKHVDAAKADAIAVTLRGAAKLCLEEASALPAPAVETDENIATVISVN